MPNFYHSLNNVSFLKKSYVLKFLFVTFVGIHTPLICIFIYLFTVESINSGWLIAVSILATLTATGITLYILRSLLLPLLQARKALEDYMGFQKIHPLPTNYIDEAGILMQLINTGIIETDRLIKENEEITALLSHNLRTPLNQITGLFNLMELKVPENILIGKKINTLIDYQLRNIEQLLFNLKVSNSNIKTPNEVFKLDDFVQYQIDLLSTVIDSKDLKVTLQGLDNQTIDSNKEKLTLVLQNLLTNAIKFSFKGGQIDILFFRENKKSYLKVKDYGLGFSENIGTHIFSNQKNVGRFGTSGEPSLGLGLSLSKKIMIQIGGELTSYSEGDNLGAEFTIII